MAPLKAEYSYLIKCFMLERVKTFVVSDKKNFSQLNDQSVLNDLLC